MDPLSAGASVIAVVQISAQVFNLCQKYYQGAKGARMDIQRLRDEVMSLQDVLTDVADLAEDPGLDKPSTLSLLNQHDGPLNQCQKYLMELIKKLEHSQGKSNMKQFGLRALKWPYSSKELEKLLTTIRAHKAMFNLALTADNVVLTRAIKDDVARIYGTVTELQVGQRKFLADERWRTVHQWLSPPDPSSNHHGACEKRQPTTGAWFLESEQFEEWKTTPKSFLWLHGIPGCGKTILCSTIVHDVSLSYDLDVTVAVAYFYFDFNDSKKQNHESLIRSLIVQVAKQSVQTPECLYALFARSQDGQQQPTTDALVLILQHILADFQQVFFIFDALDECTEREELLCLIEQIVNWKLEKLHVLVTSRRERDIEESISPLITDQICIQSALINADIRTHLCERLQSDTRLKKLPVGVKKEIEGALMDGAHGMFRWVVCQLNALRNCRTSDALKKALKSLPKTLDDTYARVLCSIDKEDIKIALRILQWLAYSARPLQIEEVAEMVAVDIGDDSRFDPEKRLWEPRDILTICSSLVTTVPSTITRSNGRQYEIEEIKLAHFSVKEYLISDRIQTEAALPCAIQEHAEAHIAQTCLIYLLHFKGPIVLTSENVKEYQLARYAAKYWIQHARAAEEDADRINELSIELFQSKSDAYINWIRLFDLDKPWDELNMTKSLENVAPPLYYASRAGLFELAKQLLSRGVEVNAQGGRFGNALQAASFEGHEMIVRLLIEKGAEVKNQGGRFGNALQAASFGGHEIVVRLLLEKGAEVNAQDEEYGNALQAASVRGHEMVVRLLLDKGAKVKAQGGLCGNALQAASENGYEMVVRLLLENGAEVNAQGGFYGNALQAASFGGHEIVIRLLLEKEAKVNAQGGYCGNALQAASVSGHEVVVRLLLEKGAEVNAQGGHCGNALQAASIGGHEMVVRLLLEKGAEVNAEGGQFGNALRAASASGHKVIIKLLLEKGAGKS